MTHGSMGFYTPCRNDDFFDENIAGLDIKSQACFHFLWLKFLAQTIARLLILSTCNLCIKNANIDDFTN